MIIIQIVKTPRHKGGFQLSLVKRIALTNPKTDTDTRVNQSKLEAHKYNRRDRDTIGFDLPSGWMTKWR